jgi:hypothetical protein
MKTQRLFLILLWVNCLTVVPIQAGLAAETIQSAKTLLVANSIPSMIIPENNKQMPGKNPPGNRQMLPIGESQNRGGRHMPEMGQQPPAKRVLPMGKKSARFKTTQNQ